MIKQSLEKLFNCQFEGLGQQIADMQRTVSASDTKIAKLSNSLKELREEIIALKNYNKKLQHCNTTRE